MKIKPEGQGQPALGGARIQHLSATDRFCNMSTSVRYRITPLDPHAHLFEVEMTVARPAAAGQVLRLPAWIPGSYMIREFARNVVSIRASARGRAVALRKLDKHTWQAAPAAGPLTVTMQVYAWDLSVRAAHLDATHGFFNGTSVFLRVIGQEDSPCEVLIEPPAGDAYADWRVATTLPEAGARRHGFGRYRAEDYDELVDHPVEMGRFTLASFDVGGARHEVAITGRHDADTARLCRDLARVCAEQVRLFEPRTRRAPVGRYLFQVMAVGDGYGGLEHRNSTALICSRRDLPRIGETRMTDGYVTLLGLVSHEYFHTWNVKHLPLGQPEELGYWFSEGFTEFYARRLLFRAGLLTLDEYVNDLNDNLRRLAESPARNSPNERVRAEFWKDHDVGDLPYLRGGVVALALDHELRVHSNGERGLDEFMKTLFASSMMAHEQVTCESMLARIEEETDADFAALVRNAIVDGADLPLRDDVAAPTLRLVPKEVRPLAPGFDVTATLQKKEVCGVIEGSIAWNSGLRDGQPLRALDFDRRDANRPLRITVVDGGADRSIEFDPRGPPTTMPAFEIGERDETRARTIL